MDDPNMTTTATATRTPNNARKRELEYDDTEEDTTNDNTSYFSRLSGYFFKRARRSHDGDTAARGTGGGTASVGSERKIPTDNFQNGTDLGEGKSTPGDDDGGKRKKAMEMRNGSPPFTPASGSGGKREHFMTPSPNAGGNSNGNGMRTFLPGNGESGGGGLEPFRIGSSTKTDSIKKSSWTPSHKRQVKFSISGSSTKKPMNGSKFRKPLMATPYHKRSSNTNSTAGSETNTNMPIMTPIKYSAATPSKTPNAARSEILLSSTKKYQPTARMLTSPLSTSSKYASSSSIRSRIKTPYYKRNLKRHQSEEKRLALRKKMDDSIARSLYESERLVNSSSSRTGENDALFGDPPGSRRKMRVGPVLGSNQIGGSRYLPSMNGGGGSRSDGIRDRRMDGRNGAFVEKKGLTPTNNGGGNGNAFYWDRIDEEGTKLPNGNGADKNAVQQLKSALVTASTADEDDSPKSVRKKVKFNSTPPPNSTRTTSTNNQSTTHSSERKTIRPAESSARPPPPKREARYVELESSRSRIRRSDGTVSYPAETIYGNNVVDYAVLWGEGVTGVYETKDTAKVKEFTEKFRMEGSRKYNFTMPRNGSGGVEKKLFSSSSGVGGGEKEATNNGSVPFDFMKGVPTPTSSTKKGTSSVLNRPLAPASQSKEEKDAPADATSDEKLLTKAGVGAGGWGNIFSKKPGEWKCEICLTMNPKEATKCMACEADKPGLGGGEGSDVGGGGGASFSVAKTASEPKPKFSFGIAAEVPTAGQDAAPKFSFGTTVASDDKKEDANASGGGFTFGAPKDASTETKAPAVSSGFTFGAPPAETKTGGDGTKEELQPAKKTKSTFSFGAPATDASTITTPAPTITSNDKPSKPETTTASFAFGSIKTPEDDTKKDAEPSTGGFSFGSIPPPKTDAPPPATTFSFGSSAPAPSTSANESKSSGFSFGAGAEGNGNSKVEKPSTTTAAAAAPTFSFGKSDATTKDSTAPSSDNAAPKPSFTFGSGAPAPAPPAAPPASSSSFQFGAGSGDGGTEQKKKKRSMDEEPAPAAPSSSFTFGAGSSSTATTTPAPAPASSTFTFGSSAPAPASEPTATPAAPSFSFGSTSTKPSEPAASNPTPSFTFGNDNSAAPAPATSSSFSFGNSNPAPTPAAPGFSFGSSNTPAPAPVPTFAPAPTPAAPAMSFGTTPAPVPPPTAPGMTFGTTPRRPDPPPSNDAGFSFGATPAAPPSFGFGAPAAPPSGFGAPAPVPNPAMGNGSSFSIGTGGGGKSKRRILKARRPR